MMVLCIVRQQSMDYITFQATHSIPFLALSDGLIAASMVMMMKKYKRIEEYDDDDDADAVIDDDDEEPFVVCWIAFEDIP